MPKKKFKDTKVGGFLSKVAPKLLNGVGDVLPDKGLLGVLKNVISKDDTMPQQDKEIALELLKQDAIEMQEVTKRLESDNEHNVTRLVRPISYAAMFILYMACIFFDGNLGDFQIKEQYIPSITSLFSTMTIFYFGSRGLEKIMKTVNKK
jgi:hypothetical protein|tara:strand:+ start:27 stop:476 length:450 start_codon:yes stop_codon:yes gene_type:complete